MIQDMFGGRISPAAAAGFVGLLSLFNMAGRFFLVIHFRYYRQAAHLYDFLRFRHRALHGLTGPWPNRQCGAVFVTTACIILSMYGGGFATIPAYLRDIFGTMHVGAIHGRLLTAWSVAGVLGRC